MRPVKDIPKRVYGDAGALVQRSGQDMSTTQDQKSSLPLEDDKHQENDGEE